MRVKICGVCDPTDAAIVHAAGADYMGVILVPGRTRSRTVAEAAAIFEAAPGIRRVGVFRDADPDAMLAAARLLRLDVVQLHGAESASVAAALRDHGCHVWKAVDVHAEADVRRALDDYTGSADALLVEGGGGGGVGARFDWALLRRLRDEWPPAPRLVLAGGLTARNVAAAVAALRPHVVDVSSGVEVTPGRKSPGEVRAFVAAARLSAASPEPWDG